MSKHRASTAVTALDSFDSRTAGEHDPGQIIILFDHRHILPRPEDNKMSSYQAYYLDGLSRMGWATYWEKPNLDPGKIQVVWYTVGLNNAPPFHFRSGEPPPMRRVDNSK